MSNPVQIDILALQQDIEQGMKRPEVLRKYGLKNNWLNRIIQEHFDSTGVRIKFRKFRNKPYEIVNNLLNTSEEEIDGAWQDLGSPPVVAEDWNDTDEESVNSTSNVAAELVSVDEPGTIVSPVIITSPEQLAERLREAARQELIGATQGNYTLPRDYLQNTSTETPIDQVEESVNNTPTGQVETAEIEW